MKTDSSFMFTELVQRIKLKVSVVVPKWVLIEDSCISQPYLVYQLSLAQLSGEVFT